MLLLLLTPALFIVTGGKAPSGAASNATPKGSATNATPKGSATALRPR